MNDGTVFGFPLEKVGSVASLACVSLVLIASALSSLGLLIASVPFAIAAAGAGLTKIHQMQR